MRLIERNCCEHQLKARIAFYADRLTSTTLSCAVLLVALTSGPVQESRQGRMPASVRMICTQGQMFTTQKRAAQLPALADFLAEEREAPVITLPYSRAAVSAALSDDSMVHLKDTDLFDVLVVRKLLDHCCRPAHGLSPDLPEGEDVVAGCTLLTHTNLGVAMMAPCAKRECALACFQKQLSGAHCSHVCTRSTCICPPLRISQSHCRTHPLSQAWECCPVRSAAPCTRGCGMHLLMCTSKTQTDAGLFRSHAQAIVRPRCHNFDTNI